MKTKKEIEDKILKLEKEKSVYGKKLNKSISDRDYISVDGCGNAIQLISTEIRSLRWVLNEGKTVRNEVCDGCTHYGKEKYIPICNNCKNGEWKQTE